MTYLLATNNPGKVKEVQAIFERHGLKLISLSDLGLFFEPTETGTTFEENAIQKAVKTLEFLRRNSCNPQTQNTYGSDWGGIAVLADDSGLCIDALDGLPGVDSANYMGRETPYEVRNAHILQMLSNSQNRMAKFLCVIACAYPCGKIITTEGAIHGEIALAPCGDSGFGYDPIFYVPEYSKTTAELTMEVKNKVSHRGKALELMIRKLTL